MLANNTDLQGIVSDLTALQKGSSGGASYGGFIGYNWQWDDVILGAELNYNHMSIGVGAQNSVGPIPIAGAPRDFDPCLQRHIDVGRIPDDPRHHDGARTRRLDL